MMTDPRILWLCAGAIPKEDGALLENLAGFSVEVAPTVLDALEHLEVSRVDAIVASFPMADWTADELLEQVQRVSTLIPVIIRDGSASLMDAVRLTKLGAYQCCGTQASAAELIRQIECAVEDRRNREQALLSGTVSHEPWRRFLVGESRAMQDTAHIIRLVGSRRCTVLITGETGTGKEMAARALHMASPRAHLPMVGINCSALPEHLLETELFGHVRGAFTGALYHRIGRFEQAHHSTLFLDEIGDMPLELQAKLLRVLQEREFQKVGSSEIVRVDIRVIAASNVDLIERVRQGKFREDLYYRLNVVPIQMPPLRERLVDIPVLVHYFIDKTCRLEEIPPKQIASEALARLGTYAWPGNIRQLENAVEVAVILSGSRMTLHPGDFPLPAQTSVQREARAEATVAVPDHGLDFEQTVSHFERSILEQALRKTKGNKKLAADMLRLKRTTLTAKLKSLETGPGCWIT